MKNSFSVLVSAGFQNLKTHLKDCIPNYVNLYENRDIANENNDIRNFVRVDKKSQNIYRWIEGIIGSNLPFSFVSNDLTRLDTQNSREPISRTTLMKYMDQLGFEIEGVLSEILSDRFALAFDG